MTERDKLDIHLDENDDPNEVFDLLEKLGEGAYGSVYKALHKETGKIVAIKWVPVGSDVISSDIDGMIKEIGVMQQLVSKYIVQYYGSYYHKSKLWIIMEYCGSGSVGDVMRMRKRVMNESEIKAVMRDSLFGLKYLHLKKKIHRDIKACNILLNEAGVAKLADFGVAGELSDEVSKRSTVIGTPFWMAPEVIQELGHDSKADIWSLGVTCIELAEGRPPFSEFHPLRAIFMIPSRPPSTLKEAAKFSPAFNDFIANCLKKNVQERMSATELLEHPFIQSAVNGGLMDTVEEAMSIIKEKGAYYSSEDEISDSDDDDDDDDGMGTMISNNFGTMVDNGTMVLNNCDTMVVNSDTMVFNSAEDCGTMVYNSDTMVDSGTMVFDSGTMIDAGGQGSVRASWIEHADDDNDDNGTMVYNESGTMARPKTKKSDNDHGSNTEPPGFLGTREELENLSVTELKTLLSQNKPNRDSEVQSLRVKYELERRPLIMAMEIRRKANANAKKN